MLERRNIRRMAGYVPGHQPLTPVVKLNTNENPLTPSDAVMQALGTITPAMLQRYPDPLSKELRRAIAVYHGCDAEETIATNGSDELLRLAITTFAEPGRAVGMLDPGYPLYKVLAAVQDCPVAAVSLDDEWLPPVNAAEHWNAAGAQVVLVANPQAPTGMLLSPEWVLELAQALDGVLVIDEAYADFVDPDLSYDFASAIRRVPNLLLARTLSKGHSLAGLRLGYGIAHAELIAPMLHKVRDSYNVDVISQRLGCVALGDIDRARESWDLVRVERARLSYRLMRLGLEAVPSQANFLLARVPQSLGGAERVHAALADRGIHVRWFDNPRLANYLRISVGTPEENDVLISALAGLALTQLKR